MKFEFKVILLISIFLISDLWAQSSDTEESEQVKIISAKARDSFFKDKTNIKDPFSLRDPFKSPLMKKTVDKKVRKRGMIRDGIFTNLPSIDGVGIDRIEIVGILVGKERRALVKRKSSSDTPVIVKEGMKLGLDDAEVKAIFPGGIVIVEKLINIYGEVEYLETVIPITKSISAQ